jgi:uncharacterized membrane protein YfcA
MTTLIVILAVLLGGFVQAVSGFGLGLIMMPIISGALGLAIARPLVAMVAATIQLTMLIRLRQSVSLRDVGIMSLVGLIGIPFGTRLGSATWLPESVMLAGLGVIIVGYALYSLIAPVLPELKNDRWLPAFAWMSGVFSGAYNVGGPPIVVYADARRWTPDQLRSNLQGFFLFKMLVLTLDHALSGNITQEVLTGYMWAFPAIFVGLWGGFWLYSYINAERFRQIVLWGLLINGGVILWQVWAGS